MRTQDRLHKALTAAAAIVASALLVAASPAAEAITIPASIEVPTGHTLFLVGHARGYQVYTCQTSPSVGWTLAYPWASLVDDAGNPVAIHYAGPSWQAADNSVVVGTRLASAPAPSPNAIPWLLLKAASTSGPAGGTFIPTTYIQRVNTAGGLAPAHGCDAAHAGATAAVFYTADYYFYRAAT